MNESERDAIEELVERRVAEMESRLTQWITWTGVGVTAVVVVHMGALLRFLPTFAPVLVLFVALLFFVIAAPHRAPMSRDERLDRARHRRRLAARSKGPDPARPTFGDRA